MLETIVTLGIIAGVTQLANKVKQSRMARRELKHAALNLHHRFEDAQKREVVQVTLFMTPEEQQVVGDVIEQVLPGDVSISKKEAASILFERKQPDKL